MSTKHDILSQHLLLDCYGASCSDSESVRLMWGLLEAVNRTVFSAVGIPSLITVLGNEKPVNNGLSGIILAPDGHFTCHTFSRRGVTFVDAYAAEEKYDCSKIPAIIEHYLPPKYSLRCSEDLGKGFGRHVILRIPPQPPAEALRLIDSIVDGIHMTRLAQRIVYVDPSGAGISDILQPITESHIALHSDGTLDVFSCKDFSVDDLMRTLESFDIHPETAITVSRGFNMNNLDL